MTDEQKQVLDNYINRKNVFKIKEADKFEGKIQLDIRYLFHGEIIEFTGKTFTSCNVEFELNGDKFRKMWYSQFADIYFNGDMDFVRFEIYLKNGEVKIMNDLSTRDFCSLVENKKFRVEVYNNTLYKVNKYSTTKAIKNLNSFYDIRTYILKCIEENKPENIGDLIKNASGYDLYEV